MTDPEPAEAVRAGDRAHGPGFTRASETDWLTKHFAGIDYGLADRERADWFARQVRGTAPEPPPDGFMLPPGFAEGLREAVAELFGIPDEMLGGKPLPPPSWRTRLRRKRDAWREHTARRAFKVIAGHWPGNGEDDW